MFNPVLLTTFMAALIAVLTEPRRNSHRVQAGLLAIFVLLFVSQANALGERGYASFSAYQVPSEDYSVVELTYMGEFTDALALKVGAAFYDGAPVLEGRDDFVGVTAAAYFHFDQEYVNPYIGAGVFFGRTYNCSEYERESFNCEDEPVAAIYPELGVSIKFHRFQIYPYLRRNFSSNNDGEASNVRGVALGYEF